MIIRDIINSIISTARLFHVTDIFDILILTVLFFQLLKITSETRSNQVLKGLFIILIGSLVASWLSLRSVSWIFTYIVNTGPLVLLIIFQPEIRRTFERVGRGKIFDFQGNEIDYESACNEIIRAVVNMSKRQVGAFIAIKGKAGLADIIESGTVIDARLSSQLLENIFEPGTPLHDGAVIISFDRITAAGCFSSTTSRSDLPQEIGARHRAAIGITENYDVTSIVVSEETGAISVAVNGELSRSLDLKMLKSSILDAYVNAGVIVENRGIRGIIGKAMKRNARGDK